MLIDIKYLLTPFWDTAEKMDVVYLTINIKKIGPEWVELIGFTPCRKDP